jgi:hypothetical protein
MRTKGRWLSVLALIGLFTALITPISYALTVTASGDSNGVCTQTVSNVSGITVTKDGTDCVVQFTTSSTITWTPQNAISARYLVVGSGGSGTRGYCSYYWGQGGGGGEVLTGTGRTFSAGVGITVTVAAASGRSGSCAEAPGADGNSSVLGTLTARGGKASLNSRTNNAGAQGGASGNGNPGGIGTANGASGCVTGACQAGGGGGAGASGNGTSGGVGINSDIVTIGTNVMYGSGGAGWAGSGDVGTAPSGGATPGSGCDAAANRGGGGADCNGTATTGGSGGSGFIVVRYTYNSAPVIGAFAAADTGSYSVNENTSSLYNINATDADAGTTLTYSLTGTDSGDFAISSSGALSFLNPPDYEAPVDSDTNNIYIVITWVSDGILSDSQTVTITVNNLTENGTISLPSITGSPTKGLNLTATVTVNTAGKVTFLIDGKRVVGCLSKSAVGTYPNLVATCTWKPARVGRQMLTALFTPSNVSFLTATSPAQTLWVVKRTTTR